MPRKEDEIYGKEMLCNCCGSHKFRILINVYREGLIRHPHFEIVCLNCSKGFVIIPNSKEYEKYFRALEKYNEDN